MIVLSNTPLTTLPDNLTIGDAVLARGSQLSEIPNNLNIREYLYIGSTPLSKQYTKNQIKQMIVDKGGNVRKVLL